MYAVVKTGGKQLVVEKDAVAVVEKIDAPVGESVTLPAVMVVDGDKVLVGSDAAKATVTATVVEHFLGEKQIVFKFKRRKGYKRTKGHRQPQTTLLITDVSVEAPKKRAAAKKSETAEAADAEAAPAKKRAAKKSEPVADAVAEAPEE
ncbi:MAG: 50S ribosomal protein L21 [Anaerosomatales bacterium]|nr:50S ribosomal protein L21 [Anaerosomatales bacterium]